MRRIIYFLYFLPDAILQTTLALWRVAPHLNPLKYTYYSLKMNVLPTKEGEEIWSNFEKENL